MKLSQMTADEDFDRQICDLLAAAAATVKTSIEAPIAEARAAIAKREQEMTRYVKIH